MIFVRGVWSIRIKKFRLDDHCGSVRVLRPNLPLLCCFQRAEAMSFFLLYAYTYLLAKLPQLGKPLFEMCWFHTGIAFRGGGDGAQSLARMIWGTFFPCLPV